MCAVIIIMIFAPILGFLLGSLVAGPVGGAVLAVLLPAAILWFFVYTATHKTKPSETSAPETPAQK